MVLGVPIGSGEETHRDRGSNTPIPWHHRYRVTHAGSYLHTQHAFYESTLIWTAKGDLQHKNQAQH